MSIANDAMTDLMTLGVVTDCPNVMTAAECLPAIDLYLSSCSCQNEETDKFEKNDLANK